MQTTLVSEAIEYYQMPIQLVGVEGIDRKDHVWTRRGVCWKCVLCGATTFSDPPEYPTPEDWTPRRYEKLTESERSKGRRKS
jgi:hypothetical protein